MGSLSFQPKRIAQPAVATAGLCLYFFVPQLGLAVMAASILFEQKPEETLVWRTLLSRLRGALIQMGVSGPTANVVCTGEFEVGGDAWVRLGQESLTQTRSRHASRLLVLENMVLLLVGLSTVGLLTFYIVAYVYSGQRVFGVLFGAVPYIVFLSRFLLVKRAGKTLEKRAEVFSLVLFLFFLLLQTIHLALVALLAFGVFATYRVYRAEAKRRLALKRERRFLVGLTKALSRRGLEAKAAALRLAARFGQLRVRDMVRNPGLPNLLEHLSANMVGEDSGLVVRVFGRALGALGYTAPWYRSAWRLLAAYEKLRAELGQQLAKNTLVAAVMFSVGSLSITLLSNTTFFRFQGNGALVPTYALDAGFVGFSYTHSSGTLYLGLFFAILVGETVLAYFS